MSRSRSTKGESGKSKVNMTHHQTYEGRTLLSVLKARDAGHLLYQVFELRGPQSAQP